MSEKPASQPARNSKQDDTNVGLAARRVERFLEAWDRKRDAAHGLIYSLHMFPDEAESRDLTVDDLRALLSAVDRG